MRSFGFFFYVRASNRVRRDDQAQRFRTDAWAIGDDEIAQAQKSFVFLPHGNIEKGVRANNEKNSVAGVVVRVPKITHRVDGIVQLGAAEVLPSFGERWNEVRMFRAGQGNHCKAVRKRREMLFQLVRRTAGRNEMNFVEIKAAVGRARDSQVAVMDRVK